MTLNGNIKIGLTQGTLFNVTASVGNGNITHQGIQLNASTETATRLKGATSGGDGKLNLSLISGNGNVAISVLNPIATPNLPIKGGYGTWSRQVVKCSQCRSRLASRIEHWHPVLSFPGFL